ncbi:MAG: HAD-IIIA family hydrolase [Rhodospirillales bacterium]|nr:HAD-IIIA family hydrolase [Rhodospirillales bacterium]
MVGRRAAFLDRDGVLAVPEFRDGRSFAVRRLADFRIYDGAAEAVRALDAAGWAVVVATNQPDIANGQVAAETVEAMHDVLRRAMPLAAIETCPHAQDAGCDCRKPRPGMLTRAAARLGLDLSASVMVGDRASDIAAGIAAGCRTVFVDRGYDPPQARPDARVDGIAAAARWILSPQAATA